MCSHSAASSSHVVAKVSSKKPAYAEKCGALRYVCDKVRQCLVRQSRLLSISISRYRKASELFDVETGTVNHDAPPSR